MYQIESNSHAVSSSIGTQESEPTFAPASSSEDSKPESKTQASESRIRKQQAPVPHQNRKRKPLRLPRLLLPILLLPRQNQNHPRSQCRNQPRNPNQNQHQSRNLIRCPQPPTLRCGPAPKPRGWRTISVGISNAPSSIYTSGVTWANSNAYVVKISSYGLDSIQPQALEPGSKHHYRHTWGQRTVLASQSMLPMKTLKLFKRSNAL